MKIRSKHRRRSVKRREIKSTGLVTAPGECIRDKATYEVRRHELDRCAQGLFSSSTGIGCFKSHSVVTVLNWSSH